MTPEGTRRVAESHFFERWSARSLSFDETLQGLVNVPEFWGILESSHSQNMIEWNRISLSVGDHKEITNIFLRYICWSLYHTPNNWLGDVNSLDIDQSNPCIRNIWLYEWVVSKHIKAKSPMPWNPARPVPRWPGIVYLQSEGVDP